MDDITALARHIRERDNPSPYTPMLGRIISLPELQIQLGSRILLYADDVQTTFDIYEKEYDSDGNFVRYKHIDKQAVILPYANDNKFIVIGVLQESKRHMNIISKSATLFSRTRTLLFSRVLKH